MKTKLFSVLAISAILFASCSNDESNPEPNDGRVIFSSGVSGLQTRVGGANGDEWTEGDPVGIFMRDNAAGKTIISGNVEYKAATAGTTTNFISTTPIYYPVNTPAKVDFVAYHPYQASLTGDYGYTVNVGTQTSQTAIDLMRATADNNNTGYDKNSSTVNLKFFHQLAKVVLVVSKGDGVVDLTGLDVKITGMNTTADFDIATATLSGEGTPAAITPYNASGATTYEAILLPTTLGTDHVVEFSVGGNTHKWKMSDNAISGGGMITKLEAGKKYTFNITVKKNEVSVSGTIEAWGNGSEANGIAD